MLFLITIAFFRDISVNSISSIEEDSFINNTVLDTL